MFYHKSVLIFKAIYPHIVIISILACLLNQGGETLDGIPTN